MSQTIPVFHADTLQQWNAWLDANHGQAAGVWLVIHKKDSGIATVSDNDAAEEALCFGWIDSLIKKIDDNSYRKLFTPRKDTAKWSAVNIARVKKLIAQGRMQPAGRAKIPDEILEDGFVPYSEARREPDEGAFLALLAQYPEALEKFGTFPASARRNYCLWVMDAKREETRAKRVEEAADLINRGVKSLLK